MMVPRPFSSFFLLDSSPYSFYRDVDILSALWGIDKGGEEEVMRVAFSRSVAIFFSSIYNAFYGGCFASFSLSPLWGS